MKTKQSKRASEPARARFLWAILSLVLPVTFGHTTACSCPTLAFSATIDFAMKCSAPCSAVLRYSPSSWAAVVHWSALMPTALRSSRKHSHSLFFLAPHTDKPYRIRSRGMNIYFWIIYSFPKKIQRRAPTVYVGIEGDRSPFFPPLAACIFAGTFNMMPTSYQERGCGKERRMLTGPW